MNEPITTHHYRRRTKEHDFDLRLGRILGKGLYSTVVRKGIKRCIAVLLSVVLAAGMYLPAAAAEQKDVRVEEMGNSASAQSIQIVEEESEAIDAAAEEDESIPEVESVSEVSGETLDSETDYDETIDSESSQNSATDGEDNQETEMPGDEESQELAVAGVQQEVDDEDGNADSGDPEEPEMADSSWLSDYDYMISGERIILSGMKSGTDKTIITIPGSATVGNTNYNTIEVRHQIWNSEVTEIYFEKGVVFPDDCSYLFGECVSLRRIELSNVDISNVTNMRDMFSGCLSLTDLDLSGFDTSNVTDMSGMFSCCVNLTEYDALQDERKIWRKAVPLHNNGWNTECGHESG